MLVDVVDVKYVRDHVLWLKFEDGMSGEVDLATSLQFTGVFEALADTAQFKTAFVDPDLGTVVWPSGADIAPESLHKRLMEALRSEAPCPGAPRRG